jgi:hypothetical protein
MSEHEAFEILCALAVVGQISDVDLRDLKLHMEGCAACRNRISDFAQISAQVLPLCGEKYNKNPLRKSTTARFVERARSEGIPLRETGKMLSGHQLLGWRGALAGSLILLVIVASISKSVNVRAPLMSTARSANVEPPNERSIRVATAQNRWIPRRRKPSPVSQQMAASNIEFVKLVGSPLKSNSMRDNAYSAPNLSVPIIEYSGNHPDKIAFDGPIFSSSGLSSEHRRLLQGYEGRSETFATASLNLPLRIFRFGFDRAPVSDSSRTSSALDPSVDWYQVWLKMRIESRRNSNDPSQYRQGVLGREWRFSEDSQSKENHQ